MAKTVEKQELTEVSEAQIAVHWKEEEYYQPSEKFKAQATLRDPRIFDKFGLDKFPDCLKAYADMLPWVEPYRTVLDTSDAPFWKWFAGGKINACYNCVDRNLAQYKNKAAFIFVPEPETERDARRSQGECGYRGADGEGAGPGRRYGLGVAALSGQVFREDSDGVRSRLLRERPAQRVQGQEGGPRRPAVGSAAVPDVLERHDREAQGRATRYRGLPGLRDRHVQVGARHSSRGRLLVHGGHRLDHGALVHRVRSAGERRDERAVRGRADVPRRGPAVAHRRAPGREHLPHRPHRHPDAAEARAARAAQVQVPLQVDDDGRRADRAGGLAMVLRRGRQAGSRHHRYVVDDRNRRLPRHDYAGDSSDEAGQLRPGGAGNSSRDLRRNRRRGPQGLRQGGQHLHPQSVAGRHADDLG